MAHGPVASLGWPAMTMQFSLDEYHGDRFSPGQAVNFTFRNSGSTFSLTTVSTR
nr:copper-binding protein [Pantoea sp. EKM20T]